MLPAITPGEGNLVLGGNHFFNHFLVLDFWTMWTYTHEKLNDKDIK